MPTGTGSRLDFGNRCDRPVTPLKTGKLSAVSEYDPANQVIGVGAGMSLAGLQDVLAEHGQWLPIRPPGGDQGTLGGLVEVAGRFAYTDTDHTGGLTIELLWSK